MRDIKFRAWDNINKIMVYPRIIKESFSAISSGDLLNRYENIMQYTGLKDKNGKEIYEGDIISDRWKVEVYKNDEGTFMIKFHNNPKINKDRSLKEYMVMIKMAGTCDIDCVVIGNIYENPELIK